MQLSRETALHLQSACRRHKIQIAVSTLLAATLCVLSVCLLPLWGRTPCQLTATAVTGLWGCILLTKLQTVRRAKRLIALCEKPGSPISGTVTAADAHTVTLYRLKFYTLEMDTGVKAVTVYLLSDGPLPELVGKTLTGLSWEHILLTQEVAP